MENDMTDFQCCGASDAPCKSFEESCKNPDNYPREFSTQGEILPSTVELQQSLCNPIHQVYFRAGLIACREYMARFVEAQDPAIAASIRANWWPKLGPDLGGPRRLDWAELAEGEPPEPVKHRGPDVVTPTLEALPVALQFLGG